MYSQVQVPIPIHMVALYSGQYTSFFGVVKCYISTNSIVIFNYLVKSCYYLYNNRIGTCATYFTDSNTTKNRWYWPDTDTDTRIGAALSYTSHKLLWILQHFS